MAPAAASAVLWTSLIYVCMTIFAAALQFEDTGKYSSAGRTRYRPKRGDETEEEQFCCWFPWNETMVEPYITCGTLDTHQRRPIGVPVYSDAGEPNFSEAAYCFSNGSQDGAHPARPDDSADEGPWCTAGPSDDCRIRCIYNATGVLSAQRRPRKRKLVTHWFKRLNSTVGFEFPVKQAVNTCLALHDQLIREKGPSNVDMCVLQTLTHYCIEEVVGRFCPRRFRTRMVVDEVCEDS